ncbi:MULTISPECIES: hypothetical protein [unclassified Microcoleus]|uniref:hypothetical protein n=1 Tax=unclassified Microcoleus TaxID=2642155 RepID=UPI002FD3D22A
MPVPQRVNFLVEQAGKPVHKRLIDNGATYEKKGKWGYPLNTLNFKNLFLQKAQSRRLMFKK